jgi:hypothetical protein
VIGSNRSLSREPFDTDDVRIVACPRASDKRKNARRENFVGAAGATIGRRAVRAVGDRAGSKGRGKPAGGLAAPWRVVELSGGGD